MANGYGAVPAENKPYDYKDYYRGAAPEGQAMNEVAPGMGMTDKLRALFGMLGVDQTPVDMNDANASLGTKIRGGLGLAPALQPRAVQADVRKADNAMGAAPSGLMAQISSFFGGAQPQSSVAPAPTQPVQAVQTDVRKAEPVAQPAQSQEPAYTGMTAADIHGTMIPPRGTGAILNETTGKVTNIDSRQAGPGAAPQGWVNRAPRGSLASFFGAAVNQRHIAGQEAAAQATALKLPAMQKAQAETAALNARKKLADAEPNPDKKAAILAGHVMPVPKLQAPPTMQPMPGDKDQSGTVFDPATGVFKKVPITQSISTANVDAALAGSMKGKTRAQVIQAYRDRGYDVSGVK